MKTYFSRVAVGLWPFQDLTREDPSTRGMKRPEFPTSFRILLLCKTLYRLASDVMFETLLIDDHWNIYLLDHSKHSTMATCEEFRHIRLSTFPSPIERFLPSPWVKLETIDISHFMRCDETSQAGRNQRMFRNCAMSIQEADHGSVSDFCKDYRLFLDVCQRRKIKSTSA